VTAGNATRLACLCDDCQIYAHYLGRAAEMLDAYGGTDLSYTIQSRIELRAGQELLRAVRLSQAGLLRVYAGCCRTPVAHVPSPKLAFVGIPHLFMRCGADPASRDALLGPLVRRFQGRFGRAPLPAGAHLGTPVGPSVQALGRAVWHTACGRHQPSPFHAPASAGGALAPAMATTVLSASEKGALRARLEHLSSPVGALAPQGCT
jgi:hypothetical protein